MPTKRDAPITKAEVENVMTDPNYSVPTPIGALGNFIYGIRWTLVPMYVGLWVAIVAYNIKFGSEVVHFLFTFENGIAFRHQESTDYLLWILNLIDITMIGNLVVMTAIGGYSTFVKEFDVEHIEGKPRWMIGLDSSTLKIKMGMSLVAVSGIHLLKTFMEVAEEAHHMNPAQMEVLTNRVWLEVLVHAVFICTTLAFTINSKLMGHKKAVER